MKRICLRGLDGETTKAVKKEALLQRAVKNHQNVLKYLTMRAVGDVFELYLEYADGGELFDQIEPDYGMEPARAQFFFRQLLNGLGYIHACGIVHRDVKPENLLLTKNNTLKISDFGMATVFRHQGSQRLLETRCGTMPYAAPEVLQGGY
uniref:Protein kinase domain-containing protein n=1 Tax=Panagrolaimus sp. ES5 TaxID=591445 RepID=A0AC34GID2_9BILA